MAAPTTDPGTGTPGAPGTGIPSGLLNLLLGGQQLAANYAQNSGATSGGSGGPGAGPLPGSISWTPDYQALIQADPAYMALSNSLSAQGIQDASARQGATDQALIQFGLMPDVNQAASQLGLSPAQLQMLQADMAADPNLAAQVQGNTGAGLSTEAQLQQGQNQAILGLRDSLAARGALGSGDDAYRTGLQDQAYAQAQSDALNKLLSAINGYQSQYTTNQQSEQQQLSQGLADALTRVEALPGNQPMTYKYDAKTGKYVGTDGSTYTPVMSQNGWVLVDDATHVQYVLNADGTIGAATSSAITSPSQLLNGPGVQGPAVGPGYGTGTGTDSNPGGPGTGSNPGGGPGPAVGPGRGTGQQTDTNPGGQPIISPPPPSLTPAAPPLTSNSGLAGDPGLMYGAATNPGLPGMTHPALVALHNLASHVASQGGALKVPSPPGIGQTPFPRFGSTSLI